MTTFGTRQSPLPVDSLFIERWSPRAFSPEPIAEETLATLFEAARWSPSCFNEQPWRFVYATTGEARRRIDSLIVESNRVWSDRAPVVMIVFAKKTFTQNGKVNRWSEFDAGAAWASLAFQAEMLGLSTHGMGGFDDAAAYELAGLDKADYVAIAAIAVGKRGDASVLPPALAAKEAPTGRKPLEQIAFALSAGTDRKGDDQ